MKKALQIVSWFAIVLGGIAILGGFSEPTAEDASYSFIGGLMYAGQGLLAILYINSVNKK